MDGARLGKVRDREDAITSSETLRSPQKPPFALGLILITDHRSLGSHGLGRGCGVGRARGIGLGRGVAVGVGVGVGLGA